MKGRPILVAAAAIGAAAILMAFASSRADAQTATRTATDATTTYSITTNQANQKITGSITSGSIPTGLTLLQ